MSSILNLSNSNALLSQLSGIAQDLGIDTWQLQTGSYNGQPFFVTSTLSGLNSKYNPAAGLYSSTLNLIGSPLGGTNGQGSNYNLPYGTNTTSTGISDYGERKIAWYSFPNNYDGWETQGWKGETFTIQGIIWGAAYTTALNNILNSFLNDVNVTGSDLHVLVHPIMGTIKNTILIKYRREHNPNLSRACLYEFVFRTNKPIGIVTSASSGFYSKLNNAISSIISMASAINNTWGDINSLATNFGSAGNTRSVQQNLTTAQTSITTTLNNTVYLVKQMVNNLAPSNYVNVQLNNYTTTTPSESPEIYYWVTNMTPNDVYSLISYVNELVDDCVAVIETVNTNPIYNTISNLTAVQSYVADLGQTLLNTLYSNTKQYTVLNDTSLVNICFLNNLNFTNQVSTILLLNKDIIFNVEYIPKGTVLLLPISNTVQKVV
jgi:hypothetical protein